MAIEEGLCWTRGGERLFYRFQPGSGGKNLILFIHGHGEHSGRYLKFFTLLQDLRCPMAIFDLRGSGRSSGAPVYISRFEEYLEDISSFLDFLKSRYPIQPPVSLVGHSLGGLIATAWARENSQAVSKLILSSPLFGIPMAPALKALVPVLNRLAPRFVIKNPVYPPYLTHDREEVERYRRDPLIQRRITPRLTYEMLRYVHIFQKGKTSFPFPVYILMAEKDYVVVPEATQRFFDRLEAPEKKLEVFRGFYHEIFNELGQDQAFERLRYYLGR